MKNYKHRIITTIINNIANNLFSFGNIFKFYRNNSESSQYQLICCNTNGHAGSSRS